MKHRSNPKRQCRPGEEAALFSLKVGGCGWSPEAEKEEELARSSPSLEC